MTTYYHLTTLLLAPGSILEPGNWKRMMDFYPYVAGDARNGWKLASEYAFEAVRAAHFSDCPSRMNCCFAFESESDATAQRPQFGPHFVAYEVEPVDPEAPVHRGAFNLFNQRYPAEGTPFVPHAERIAHAYWSGQNIEVAELLCTSPLRIVRRLA